MIENLKKNSILFSIRMGKAISGVMVFTLMAKLLGFCREVLLSFFFGASGVSDAYLISQTIPGTIFQFVGVGLTTCFVPVYIRAQSTEGRKIADCFTNALITIVFSFSTIIIVIIWRFTPFVVKVFASGFEGSTLYYAVWFTRIGVLSLYFSTIIYIYTSYLQANKIFAPSAFAAIPNSLCIMLAIFIGAKYNLWLLPIGSCLAVFVQMFFLIIPVYRIGFKLNLNLSWDNRYVKIFFGLLFPVILGVSVNQINTLVDKTIASQVAVGGISALTYANSLIGFIQGGLIEPISIVTYPEITKKIVDNNDVSAKESIEKALNFLVIILIPISLGFAIFRYLITESLFGRGEFDEMATEMTSTALAFYSVGLCFIGIRELLSRFYYAYSNTRVPMWNASVGVVVNIVMNILLSRIFGIAGLSIATSASAFVTAILLWMGCDKHLKCGSIILSIKNIVKSIFASIISMAFTYYLFKQIRESEIPNIINLMIIVSVAAIVYFISGWILKIDVFLNILDIIKSKNKSIK